ncbi:triple functional domain protein-like isoform X2 [Condylostylus longicornis]|nr:triple functional domain protein-like isoform X2 [Condylostylus longicornis]
MTALNNDQEPLEKTLDTNRDVYNKILVDEHEDILNFKRNLEKNDNCIYENNNEEYDNIAVETRRKIRAFKSITQVEEKNKIYDDIKYYSHPNRIPENRTSDIKIYQNMKSSRDSQASILEHIVDELVKTEESFVFKLKTGYENYKKIFAEQKELPKGLIGKKYVLFRTIEEILDFHENEMLPMLQANQYDLNMLCSSFSKFIEENKFYPHLMYIMHKKRAENLCKYYKSFFDEKAKEFNDNLGIMSLLIQPLHRVTKYPLLFQQIIKDCFKNYDMKPILQFCCKTEKKMSDYVKLINESERVGSIINVKENVNLYEAGRLKKVDKFYVYDYNLQKRFKSRVFLFEKSLVYTEISNKMNSEVLKFRGLYPCDKLSMAIKEPGFTLYWEKRQIQDCDLEAKTEDIRNSWIETIKNIIVSYLEKKRLQSQCTGHFTAYNHLFRYKFLNRRISVDSITSTSTISSAGNQSNNRISIISTGSFHSYNTA